MKRYCTRAICEEGKEWHQAERFDVVLLADHLADRASLLAVLRQCVEAMEWVYKYADDNDVEEMILTVLAACREKLDLDPMDGTRETDKDGNRV